MAPQTPQESGTYQDSLGLDRVDDLVTNAPPTPKKPPMVIVWRNVIIFFFLHAGMFYSFTILSTCMWQTAAFTVWLYFCSAMSITAGAHRLWSHRAYKARLPLRIYLVLCNCMAFQNSVYEWSRDHRAHHKFSETDGDPHNAKRGFFFSHMGWLLIRKHPEVKKKGKVIDLSDLSADPILMFQDRHYKKLMFTFCFILPTIVPHFGWGESLKVSYFVCAIMRYMLSLHATWLVNSAAHMWGNKPYDERINPAQNLAVSLFAQGEGFHNYHHVFPHDYSTSEYGWKVNLTTMFIDLMYMLGQAYDLRTIPKELVNKRKQRTGDGTD